MSHKRGGAMFWRLFERKRAVETLRELRKYYRLNHGVNPPKVSERNLFRLWYSRGRLCDVGRLDELYDVAVRRLDGEG